jgi:hypothetical protein
MAEERIDIEVTDKVDSSAAKSLNAIADAADRGANYVDKLKSALASVNTNGVDKLVSAMARADSAQAKLLNAQMRLTAAQDTGALSAAKLATQNQKLATEAARTEAATARAAAASTSAEAAAIRLTAAQQRVTASAGATGTAEEILAADLARAKVQFDAGEISIRQYVTAMNAARTASTGAADPIVDSANKASGAADTLAKAQSRTKSTNANIIAQLQDIGVSLAGGQNPLLVLVQQGSQLDYIARTTAGGWAGLVKSIVAMLAPLAVVAAAIGLLYVGYKSFSDSIAKQHKPELQAYAETLGLTEKEMNKLGNTTVGANGKLKTFDVATITAADSWNGFKSAVSQGWDALLAPFAQYTDTVSTVWSSLMNFLLMAFVGFSAAVNTLIKVIGVTAVNIVKAVLNSILGISNAIIMTIQAVINGVITGLDFLADNANKILSNLGFDKQIPIIDKVNLGIEKLSQNMFEASELDIGKTFKEEAQKTMNTIQGFKEAWDGAATAAAKARIAALAAAIIENRKDPKTKKEKVDHTAERRALAIGMVNLKLDDELSRMKLLKDERAVQQRMDQIEEGLAQKKIHLNDAERLSIEGKVRAIEAYKYIQAESDRIVEEANGPARTMNATIEAATALFDAGTISNQKYAEQLHLATRTYEQATDPLFSYNETIDSMMKTTGLYGTALEKANYLEGIRIDLANKGISIYDASGTALTKEVAALVAKNDALRQQQLIQSQLGAVVNPILAAQDEVGAQAGVYAELQRLRDQDLINEGTYQQAKAALWVKYNESKLTATSDFFGALASLTAKGHGVVGAISKAAAVAEATISGYVAVQKALASAPPPFNMIAAAAVAIKTGANVAGILSTNAGSYATGGQFMVQGKGGIDSNNINMNVTRGERVTVETAKQQRENDAATGGNGDVSIPLKIVNNLDPRMALDAIDTSEGEQVVMNIISRNAPAVQRLLGSN